MKSTYFIYLALLLALSACSPANPAFPPGTNTPESVMPSPTNIPTSTTPPATAEPTPVITHLSMVNANEGWAWTDSTRLLHTTDGGQTWVDHTPEGQINPDGFFSLDGQTAWLSIFLEDASRFGVLQTTDGGQTWKEYPYGPASGLQFADALNGWAAAGEAGAGNIYYMLSETKDGGKTWNPIPARPPQPEEGLPVGTIHLCNICNDSFFYDPSRMIIVYGDMGSMQPGGSVRMQISFDLGNSWRSINLPLPADNSEALVAPYKPVFFGDKQGLLPVSLLRFDNGGSFIYKRLAFYLTQDGGSTWTLAPSVLDNISQFGQIKIVSAEDIYVLCGNDLCTSHDGARTWQTLKSNLDFTQNDIRSVGLLDFLNIDTGWVSITENNLAALYQTTDGGTSWTQLSPMLIPSAPAVIQIETDIPTPTLVPTPTLEPTSTPQAAFDRNTNAYRINFAPNGTWAEISDTISANTPKRFVLAAAQGQVMSVSIRQGAPFSVQVTGADKKALSDPATTLPFWRGVLPSTQDYIVSIVSQASGPFTLRVAIDPLGKSSQIFTFTDPGYLVSLSYTDKFAPTDIQIPVSPKGTPLLTLTFIDPAFYSPRTNLSEAYFMLAATSDSSIVSTCLAPSTQVAEVITGTVNINNFTFTRSEFSGAAAGNRYDQIAYRTTWNNKCFEMILLIHSANIGNYPPGSVAAYDQAALISQFETVLNTFLAK